MSLQDIILTSISNLQTDDGDIRGVLNHLLNTKSLFPFIDIYDSKDDLTIYVELPGFHTNIKISFLNNKLTISGTKNYIKATTNNIIKNELSYGNYSRDIILPIYIINKNNVSTKYEKGVLCIKINKNNEQSNKFIIDINT